MEESESKKEPERETTLEQSEEQKEEPEKEDVRQRKELRWIFGILLGMILVFLISFSTFQKMSSFEYEGMTFAKERFGDTVMYHYSYYFNEPDPITGQVIAEGNLINYNLYIRNDPRKNIVPVEGEIELDILRDTYISINTTGLTECTDSSAAIGSLASFLNANSIPIHSATPIRELADLHNYSYAACDEHPPGYVIIIERGQESRIVKENRRCYVITTNECNLFPAIEKFQTQSIIDARARHEAANFSLSRVG